jgi:hypothetical protein
MAGERDVSAAARGIMHCAADQDRAPARLTGPLSSAGAVVGRLTSRMCRLFASWKPARSSAATSSLEPVVPPPPLLPLSDLESLRFTPTPESPLTAQPSETAVPPAPQTSAAAKPTSRRPAARRRATGKGRQSGAGAEAASGDGPSDVAQVDAVSGTTERSPSAAADLPAKARPPKAGHRQDSKEPQA